MPRLSFLLMLWDLLIGIAASLIVSGIVGFLGNKAISKQNSIVLKVYILFLSMSTFVISGMISIIFYQDFVDRVVTMNEVNILRFYSNCINRFIFVVAIIVFVLAIAIGIKACDRGVRRDHKEDMDRYQAYDN